jgi:hypothetical protein
MTDKAVSALTSLTGANAATGDLLYIVDISEASAADRSKKITAQELQNYIKGFPATIGVGGATPSASGAGISFPATASASSDANTLDDYEEGTWTPTLSNFTLGNGTATGYYTKVGNIITVSFLITLGSTSSVTGSMLDITGLPIASNIQTSGYIDILDAGTIQFAAVAQIPSGSSTINFRVLTASGSYVSTGTVNATTPMTWTTSDQISGFITYRIA